MVIVIIKIIVVKIKCGKMSPLMNGGLKDGTQAPDRPG